MRVGQLAPRPVAGRRILPEVVPPNVPVVLASSSASSWPQSVAYEPGAADRRLTVVVRCAGMRSGRCMSERQPVLRDMLGDSARQPFSDARPVQEGTASGISSLLSHEGLTSLCIPCAVVRWVPRYASALTMAAERIPEAVLAGATARESSGSASFREGVVRWVVPVRAQRAARLVSWRCR